MASPLTHDREPSERSWLWTALLTLGIVAILGVAFTVVAYFMSEQLSVSQEGAAAHQVRVTLTNACNAYKLKNGDWPDDLHALTEKGERGGPYLDSADALRDPWARPYQYDYHGPENDGVKPDIWAVHPTTGQKIGNWPTP
jgi:hypothetical protein